MQVEPIEARVAAREATRVPALLDRKPPRSIAALEILEAVDGNARGARGELEQARFALREPRTEARPEPLDHPVRLLVPAVVREPRPVVHVELHHPPDEKFRLVLVEHRQRVERQHVPEPLHECAELLRDPPGDPVRYDEIDVLFFVCLRHVL